MEVDDYVNNKTSMKEPIIKDQINGNTFEIGILNKRGIIEDTTIIFDSNKKIILLKTKVGIQIKINYDDIISFSKDDFEKLKKNQEENQILSNSNYIS